MIPLLRCRNRAARMIPTLRCFSQCDNSRQRSAVSVPSTVVTYLLPNQTATEDVATLHSAVRELKDVHLISGTLGAGKSTFCRAYVRFACDDEDLAVPSPTYTLLNTYQEEIVEGPPIHHLDLYRLNSTAGQNRLQLPDLWLSGSTLIEWPDRLQERPETYFTTVISTCAQGDAAALQEMAEAWGVAAVRQPDCNPDGDDCRWRVLSMTGHGVDVRLRHEAGMQELEQLQIDPDFAVVPDEYLTELLSIQSFKTMAEALHGEQR